MREEKPEIRISKAASYRAPDRLRVLFLALGVFLVTATGLTAKKEPAPPAPMNTQKQLALVRVNVTGQTYDYFRPWQKKAPFSKLAGLLLRYDSRSQLLDAIPAPIITHFLKEAASRNYRGFPAAGFSFFPTRDPELRQFAGEKGKGGGVYVTNVEPKTPAMKAG